MFDYLILSFTKPCFGDYFVNLFGAICGRRACLWVTNGRIVVDVAAANMLCSRLMHSWRS